MGKIVVQTFLFNIDSNWLAGLFPSTVLLCILLRFITLYYNILQLSVQYQFISSKSTGAWKNLQDHKLKSHQSPQLTNFHLSVAAMCCRRSSRFSLFVKGKSQATPVSHLTQLRSFAAGFLSTTRPSQYQFRNSCVVNKNLRNQLTNSTEINFVDSQKKNTIDHDISGIAIRNIHTWKIQDFTSLLLIDVQHSRAWKAPGSRKAQHGRPLIQPCTEALTRSLAHGYLRYRRGSEAFIR